VCGADGYHEWKYHQEKHKAAVHKAKGLVDQSQPRSLNPATQHVQARTRRFCEGQRQAEIGRENRKLVERLAVISKGGEHGNDPRQPPNTLGVRSMSQPSLQSASISVVPDRLRSLNEPGRRKTQKEILDSNASLVRRILHTKGQLDRMADEKDWKRHQRAGVNLRRMPEPREKEALSAPPRTLPPMRPPREIRGATRKLNFSAPLLGLDALMLPSDLLPLGDLPKKQASPRRIGRTMEGEERPTSRGSPSRECSRRSGSGSRGRSGGSPGSPNRRSDRSRSRSRSHSRSRGSRSPRSRSGSPRGGRSRSPSNGGRSPRSRSSASPRSPGATVRSGGLGYTQDNFEKTDKSALGYTQDFDAEDTAPRGALRTQESGFGYTDHFDTESGATSPSAMNTMKTTFRSRPESDSNKDSESQPPASRSETRKSADAVSPGGLNTTLKSSRAGDDEDDAAARSRSGFN